MADTRITVYLSQAERDAVERNYQADGSASITEFAENAINFYLAYLHAQQDGVYLPAALRSVMEGQLGMLQGGLTKLLFKLTVEQDMMMTLLADSFELDEEYLRRLRGRSINHVKQTNGQLTFEQIVRNQALD